MSVRENAKTWSVREQIVEDPVTGLTFQFEVMPDRGLPVLRIYGDLPFGNREIIFSSQGEEAGAGSATSGVCRPGWLEKVD
jgi:hypothetical protein